MKCIVHPTGEAIEIAPGERYVDLPQEIAPKFGIIRWMPAGDGTFRPRVQVLENVIRVTEARQYGIHISRETIIRLGVAGFVSISQLAPMTICVSLESLLDHIDACKDPEFWTEERLVRYRKALPIFRD
jgi:hypothetical protein